ncbi:MAG: GNAT family N-acetyltransferase [Planctomycetota bacterium]|jgi:predicted acetyltransferase
MDYRRPQSEEAYAELGAILANAFAGTPEQGREWLRDAGDAEARALSREGEIVAGFVRRPMGQWWGGRSVPMLGVAAVGVAPHARGSGVATALMHEAVCEMYTDGFPLSVLFAASFPLYRRAGYELAGNVHQISAALVPLQGDRSLPMRRARDEDEAALRELQRAVVSERNGPLDRSDVMWRRQMSGPGGKGKCDVHVVENEGRIDGYIAHVQRERGGKLTLAVRDIVARNEAAGRRLLGFLADHKAQVQYAAWNGDAADPIVTLLNTRRYRIVSCDQWMLRIVDLKKALEQRGYPAGVRGSLHLELEDDLLEANCGRWILEVEGGAGRVRPGGTGALRAGARGLAPLYSGFLPPATLRRCGWIEADDESCAVAASLFGGSAPYMSEQF